MSASFPQDPIDGHASHTYSRALAPTLSPQLSGVLPPGWM